MALEGRALWREAPGETPVWVDGTWTWEDGRLHRVTGPGEGRDRDGAVPACWIVPGMVDVHCHIGIGPSGPVGREEQERQALADRDSGVLAVRDCGVPVDDSWVQGRPDLPVLVRSGRHIARPKRYTRGLAVELEDPGDLPGEVLRQARAGDGWVKLVGDWIDRTGGAESDLDPLWPREILRDAVAAAHEEGARVAVHCFSHRVVDDLLEAGVDDIEHGTGMDDDQMAEAAVRGVMVTPTLVQVELFGSFADQAGRRYPRYAETMRAMHRERRDHAERLLGSGVWILPGMDAGGYQPHGELARELALWSRAGMSPDRILEHATWRARDALRVDSLQEEARADLLVLDSDPTADPGALARPRAVVLGGRVLGGG
ncbi:MAG: amidohydrolase family protein [Actinomyces sp.]|nr:amidohydrolase family protein [Actinomyces sp.]MCI1641940.1 amidohydrolase family protein [Actinomyces sp.]MCI1661953.1 amidohydrolase family protein [Actinomyces sp.]MCI1691168.1 amidohydrolase family protein [Actinomyces sp.]MCI1787756.1 amidohydrolase family protein [Actinomyces sp.]MCI1830337.1 amidohydrolase family protein [Actinomyces sp.]